MAESADRPAPVAERPETVRAVSTPETGKAGAAESDRHWRLAHLPVVLGASLGLLVLATLIGGLVRGGAGAAGAAAGVGLVTVSYLSSTLVIAWADSVHSSLVLPFGVAMYVAKFGVIGVVMAGVADSGWAGLAPFGWGVVVGVIAWTGANIWWVTTVHQARLRRAAQP
ncbi:hypothetical protein ACFP2T_39650 [Plantactinospora solaniradicis]|uniref:ATP synthase protein I n=1 Tax=Plantactinospora solaniradicis TaxID=1723736 RepID=A0ABW1KKT9_9ACTN